MDVNETLREARAAAEAFLNSPGDGELADTLAERFQALDEWLSKGGFLPEDWSRLNAIYRKSQGV